MSFDAFLSTGWGDHGTDAEGVFARLPEGERLVTEARHLAGLHHQVQLWVADTYGAGG